MSIDANTRVSRSFKRFDDFTPPIKYVGLKAIAKRLGRSQFSVRTLIAKYHFPAYRLPSQNRAGGYGYMWETEEHLIRHWQQSLIDESRESMIRSTTGRNLAYTREPNHQPDSINSPS